MNLGKFRAAPRDTGEMAASLARNSFRFVASTFSILIIVAIAAAGDDSIPNAVRPDNNRPGVSQGRFPSSRPLSRERCLLYPTAPPLRSSSRACPTESIDARHSRMLAHSSPNQRSVGTRIAPIRIPRC